MRKIILVRIQLPVYQILIRRLRCASLALVFVCSVFTSIKIYAADVPLGKGLQNFSTNTISSPTFSDVSASDWFHPYVQSVASYGLMIGDNNAAFNPFAQITIAEAITIAARLHSIYHTGEEAFRQGEIWYKTYWEYAKNAEITNLDISVCEQQATRAEFAQIISRAFPPNALPAINTLSDSAIPDVSLTSPFGEAVYFLYRAGILVGSDTKGTFNPDSNISRSEVATIISRMVVPEERMLLTLDIPTKENVTGAPSHPTENIPADPTITGPAILIDSAIVKPGQRVPITISLKNNPGISALGLTLSFDDDICLDSIVFNDQLAGDTIAPQILKNPSKLLWINPFEDVSDDFLLATVYFTVSPTAEEGQHPIFITYNANDVYNLSEENVPFEIIHGSIEIRK